MKLLKGYYAYLAVSGGLVLNLAVQSNWMLRIVAFALVSAGALSVQSASRWYTRASIAADVYMAFSLVLGPAVIPPGLLRMIEHSALPEWVLLVVWSAGYILTLLAAPGWLNDFLFSNVVTLANTCISIGTVALIVEMFRAQRIYLQTEEQ